MRVFNNLKRDSVFWGLCVVAKFWFWAPRLGFFGFFVEPNFSISGGVTFDFCALDFWCLLWPNFGFRSRWQPNLHFLKPNCGFCAFWIFCAFRSQILFFRILCLLEQKFGLRCLLELISGLCGLLGTNFLEPTCKFSVRWKSNCCLLGLWERQRATGQQRSRCGMVNVGFL